MVIGPMIFKNHLTQNTGIMERLRKIFKIKCGNSLVTLTILHIVFYSMVLLYSIVSELDLKLFLFVVMSILINSLSFTNIALSDPGFISKKPYNTNEEEEVEFSDGLMIKTVFEKGSWLRFIDLEGNKYIQKYCEECNIFKTIDAAHCRECDNCVMEMDHHCFWFDICIGRNNIGFFYLYIFSCLPVLYHFKNSSYELYKQSHSFTKIYTCWIKYLCFLLSKFSYIFITINLFFILYYTYLLLTDIRSRDFIKGNERRANIKLTACLLRLITDKKVLTCEDLR